jgi:dTDP-4-dehydrorhamnose 3,5-epimerase
MKLLGAKLVETRRLEQGAVIHQLEIPGLSVVEPRIFRDTRGCFLETWQDQRYRHLGLEVDFVQDNLSVSAQGVLRGLHFQHPDAQAKLVSVIEGAVFDVAVDVRHGSPTFGRWAALYLDDVDRRQFYVPRGFAHGFCVLSPKAIVSYKCDGYYAADREHMLLWSDPDLDIPWPNRSPELSLKDAAGLRLRDFPASSLPPFTA